MDRAFRWVNPGPRGALPATGPWGDSGDPPTAVTGIPPVVRLRVGGAAAVPTPSWEGGEPEGWTIDPPLPAGLSLDARTGATAGAPTAPASTTSHSITAWNPHGTVAATFDLQVAPALPAGMVELEDGWQAEVLHAGLAVPVKMARAPDGRLFFNELGGSVRVAGADGVLRGAPVAAISVVTGGERGLLGIAVAPDFATRPALFVFATTPAGEGLPERNRVLRLDLDGDVATATAVVVDQLPAGVLGNGGDVRFGPDGMLYVSLGDTGDPSLAQRDGERAGRVLRYAPDGSVPGDNPVPGDPEWCRGFRNPFDLEFHPVAGTLFATENGPAAHDELNLLLRGRNHEWEELPEDFPGSMVGVRLRDWTPVIVPTGLAFHPDGGDGGEGADALFVAGYDRADVRRLVMSGAAFTDVDEERPFARWSDEGLDHRPLDLVVTPDGDLLVSTFTAIWRLRKAP